VLSVNRSVSHIRTMHWWIQTRQMPPPHWPKVERRGWLWLQEAVCHEPLRGGAIGFYP